MDRKDKVVLITGASRGLGRALALRWAREGARVALVARHRDTVEKVAEEISQGGGRVVVIVADVAEPEAATQITARVMEAYGRVDILVNNAGTLGPVPLALLLDTEPAEIESAMATNVLGPFRLIRALAGAMLLQGEGIVVNVSSDAAVEAYPKWGAYAVSKAALDHLTRLLTVELAGTGIRFLRFDPGEMDTKMHADAVPEADPATLTRPDDAAATLLRKIEEEL